MVFDILLLILALVALLVGLIGSVLPLPGPPLSFLGLMLLHWTRFADFSDKVLWTMGILTVLVTVIDMIVPVWGVKRFGGTKFGIWGSTLGLLVGMTMGPWGVFVGAFLGGLAGEILAGQSTSKATRAAWGSFVGFLSGVLLKLALCGVMLWYAGVALVQSLAG